MAWETHPVTPDRFEDFADVLNRSSVPPTAGACPTRPAARRRRRRQGVTTALLEGACAWAASRGAPAVEAYPVDPAGERMDLTMAFVGTRAMFAKVGFEVVGTTDATASGLPRLVMRRDLTSS